MSNDQALVDFYDCTGKPDGNYIHPFDCTKFITCEGQVRAYEMYCADCHVNPDNCPHGRLHYDHGQDACLWSYEAGCIVDPPP
ncbi:carbohydrate-binding module family 14 protein [Nocardia sp. NPDC049149]|uniref:carbohydrate-binding module family 14 protein n=1 Tax=Nocardia sp. NPDC049149 TaxID=3364315 RepID=UPI00372343DD